jgi:hypothetical protein
MKFVVARFGEGTIDCLLEVTASTSEAGLFQLLEFHILDVTPGKTHLSVKSRMVIVNILATNFLFSIQDYNSTSYSRNATSNARLWHFYLGLYYGQAHPTTDSKSFSPHLPLTLLSYIKCWHAHLAL